MRQFLVLIFLVFCIPPASAQTTETAPTTSQFTLPNGMRVVVQSIPWEKLVWVETFYNAGAATEPDSLAGLAHLSEHLLTDSGHQYPDGQLVRLQTLYSTYRNAFTATSSMCFLTQCLPEFLGDILDLEVDRMNGAITDSVSFEREKSVVLEELAYRSRLSPSQKFFQSLFQVAYEGHPYGREVGGTSQSVGKIQMDDFMDFQTQRISPDKAVLVISGPVDAEVTMELVRSRFDFGPPSEPCLPELQQYPPIGTGQIILDASDHSGFLVGIGCRIPLESDLDAALAYSLNAFFDQAWVGTRLIPVPDEVVFIAYQRRSYFLPPTDPEQHYGMAFPEVDSEQDAQRTLGAIWYELHDVLDDLKDPEVFEEAKALVLNTLGQQDDIKETGSGMGQAMINGNGYLDSQAMADLLESATPADLQDFAKRYLQPEKAVVSVSHGYDSGRQSAINMTGRVVPNLGLKAQDSMDLLGKDLINPVLEVYQQSNLFQFQQTRLPNGIPLHCLVIPDADRWYLGSYRTFPELKILRHNKMPGLDYLYNRVVSYDESQRRDRFDPKPPRKLPFNLYMNVLPWRLSYGADGPSDSPAELVKTISQRIKSREFNNSRWSNALYYGKKNLDGILNSPINKATTWRRSQVYKAEYAFFSPWAPDPDTAAEVKYKDLKKLHSSVTGKVGNTVLVAAGPLDITAVEAQLKGTLGRYGQWEKRSGFSGGDTKIQGIHGKVFHDPEKGDVRLNLAFPPQAVKNPDDSLGTAVLLLQSALNLSLKSRLREKEGLTYHVSCLGRAMGEIILWEVSMTCQPGQAPVALESLKDELSRCINDGFTADQWAQARLDLLSNHIAAFTDPASGRNLLIQLASFGEIPADPMAMVFNIEHERINAMAREMLDAENFSFTATGPLFEEDIDQF